MVFLETALESKLNPLVALGRTGSLGLSGFVNKFNAEAELLDDLVRSLLHAQYLQLSKFFQQNDHWTARNHKVFESVILSAIFLSDPLMANRKNEIG